MSDCGRCGESSGHVWVEGDCVLPHRNHSLRLLTGAHVCIPCVERHVEWLREIVDLYATLAAVLFTGSVPDDTAEHKRPKKAAEAPAPVRLEVLAMLTDRARLFQTGHRSDLPDVPAVLAGWAQYVHDTHGWTSTAPDTLTGAAATLRANAEHLARQPDVDTYDAELRWVRNHLRRAHGLVNARPVGKCPSLDGWGNECGGPLWPDPTGRMAVQCGRCERIYDELMLRHLGGMIAS